MADGHAALGWGQGDGTGRIEFARACHANLQDMVKVADAKATAIIAMQAVVVALLGSNLVDAFPDVLRASGWWGLGGIALAALACTLGSMIAAMIVLVPRVNVRAHVHPPMNAALLMWLDDLKRFGGDSTRYAAAFAATTPEQVLGDFAYENLKIASILATKFLWLPRSLKLLAAASVGWAVTLAWAVATTTNTH
jgi:hypothetical protein